MSDTLSKYLPWLGIGVVAYVALKPKTNPTSPYTNTGSGTTSTATGTANPNFIAVANAPNPPTTFNEAYYNQYVYPALVAKYPEIQNSNHQLTDTEANNYKNNYLELRQWLQNVVPGYYKTEKQALQFHWTAYAVPGKYSYVPFYPSKNAAWVNNEPITSGGDGGSWVTDALGVASTIIGFLGTEKPLNPYEIEVLLTGGYALDSILPMYVNTIHGEQAKLALNRFDDLVEKYA